MKPICRTTLTAIVLLTTIAPLRAADPLPSWNEGPTKQSILNFVQRVTTNGPHFVPPAQRIAVFDNDGTLWAEQPLYFQVAFVFDRIKALAPQHPDWNSKPNFQAAIAADLKGVQTTGENGLPEVILTTHSGVTTDEFAAIVTDWLKTARHPRFQRPYTDLAYQPMLEVLQYFRANDFKTYIVSGGGVDFLRVFAEQLYGVPPEQVIGSIGKVKLETRDGKLVLVKLPEIDFINDKAGKAVAIHQVIGRRPIAAFGNSDGDLQMLQWTGANDLPHLCVIVHHTDDQREWSYDRASPIGRLDKSLDEATANSWTIVDMKKDWKRIFAFEGR